MTFFFLEPLSSVPAIPALRTIFFSLKTTLVEKRQHISGPMTAFIKSGPGFNYPNMSMTKPLTFQKPPIKEEPDSNPDFKVRSVGSLEVNAIRKEKPRDLRDSKEKERENEKKNNFLGNNNNGNNNNNQIPSNIGNNNNSLTNNSFGGERKFFTQGGEKKTEKIQIDIKKVIIFFFYESSNFLKN